MERLPLEVLSEALLLIEAKLIHNGLDLSETEAEGDGDLWLHEISIHHELPPENSIGA